MHRRSDADKKVPKRCNPLPLCVPRDAAVFPTASRSYRSLDIRVKFYSWEKDIFQARMFNYKNLAKLKIKKKYIYIIKLGVSYYMYIGL